MTSPVWDLWLASQAAQTNSGSDIFIPPLVPATVWVLRVEGLVVNHALAQTTVELIGLHATWVPQGRG